MLRVVDVLELGIDNLVFTASAVDIALRLLASSARVCVVSWAAQTVSEIAYAWGFSDMTHFGRKFRRVYGLSPSEYRKRARTD
jgi:AraC-like DNA-binding protein